MIKVERGEASTSLYAENRNVPITQTGECQNRQRVLHLLGRTSDC
jgi:hypothetical protein